MKLLTDTPTAGGGWTMSLTRKLRANSQPNQLDECEPINELI